MLINIRGLREKKMNKRLAVLMSLIMCLFVPSVCMASQGGGVPTFTKILAVVLIIIFILTSLIMIVFNNNNKK